MRADLKHDAELTVCYTGSGPARLGMGEGGVVTQETVRERQDL